MIQRYWNGRLLGRRTGDLELPKPKQKQKQAPKQRTHTGKQHLSLLSKLHLSSLALGKGAEGVVSVCLEVVLEFRSLFWILNLAHSGSGLLLLQLVCQTLECQSLSMMLLSTRRDMSFLLALASPHVHHHSQDLSLLTASATHVLSFEDPDTLHRPQFPHHLIKQTRCPKTKMATFAL